MSLIRMGSYVPAFILGYLSVKSWFLFWGIDLEGAKTYNDIKFCKEPKTIIVVDKWLSSLNTHILVSGFSHLTHQFSFQTFLYILSVVISKHCKMSQLKGSPKIQYIDILNTLLWKREGCIVSHIRKIGWKVCSKKC